MSVASTSYESPSDSVDSHGNLKDFVVPDSPVQRRDKKRKAVDAEIKNIAAKKATTQVIIGRDAEVARMVRMLSQPTPQRPLLIGSTGIGKRSIVRKLAQYLSSPECPKALRNRKILMVNSKKILGQALAKDAGEIEFFREEMQKIKEKAHNPIIFFQDIDVLVNNDWSIGNIFQAFLQSSSALIGSISNTDDQAKALELLIPHNFLDIDVKEPSLEETTQIVHEYLKTDQNPTNVLVAPDALKLAVKLSGEHIKSQPFPIKVIRLVSEAVSQVRIQASHGSASSTLTVTSDHIAKIMQDRSGIPSEQLISTDHSYLERLYTSMKEQLIGQNHAIEIVFRCIQRGILGFRDRNKPKGVFLLLGPTGVGKTELAKIIARETQSNFLRFDMSEYQESHSISRLIGSPPGYIGHESGGALTSKIRRDPHSVVLFDEMEKAHPDIAKALLQVFDEGRMTDGCGVTTDCTEALFMMTSNLGSKTIFAEKSKNNNSEQLMQQVLSLVESHWSPEFLGRLTAVIPFQNLSASDYPQVIDVLLKRLSKEFLDKHHVTMSWSPRLISFLIEKHSKDMRSGVRGLCERVKTEVYDLLAEAKISGKIVEKSQAYLTIKENQPMVALKGK